MFLLALLGCQAFASDSNAKGEADLESNEANSFLMTYKTWRSSVTSRVFPKGSFFDEKGCVAYLEKKLWDRFKSYQLKKTEVGGGTWIRGTVDGLSLSAFMHRTKRHAAGVFCGKTGKVQPNYEEIVEPGNWAVAFGNATSCGLSSPVYKTIE